MLRHFFKPGHRDKNLGHWDKVLATGALDRKFELYLPLMYVMTMNQTMKMFHTNIFV